MINSKNRYLFVLILLSFGMAIDEFVVNSRGEFVSTLTNLMWLAVFFVLSILWAVKDAQVRHFDKPFDFDFLMYVLWPIAFPYYLIKTRGLEGAVLFIGFLALYLGPWMVGTCVYLYQ